MSADHRRPLFAFVLVLVVCVIIMVNGLKGQAVVVALRTGAGHVVRGVELVATRGDHGQQSRQLMEPPVLQAGATTVFVAQPATPAAPVSPESSTSPTAPAGGHAHAQQPSTPVPLAQPHPAAGHGHGHHGEVAQDEGRGHRTDASQHSAQQVVHGLTHDVEQLLGVHEDTGPSRGPGAGETRAHGHGRGADHDPGVRGHHLGQLLGYPHGLQWARHR